MLIVYQIFIYDVSLNPPTYPVRCINPKVLSFLYIFEIMLYITAAVCNKKSFSEYFENV